MNEMNKNTKVLVLFSGGLDSQLAALILKQQGIEVTALCFTSAFFGSAQARKAAAAIGLKLREEDIGAEQFALVKNPPNGYGKNMNPCIDCHALMIRRAGEIKVREGFDIVATGEVLGQRPFSQNKEALRRVAKLAGAEVLRPLCAKLLPPTAAEEAGLVKRHKLQAISGRSREKQFELAEEYGLREYATPAGGCLLTDPEFSNRLLKLLGYWPECGLDDVALLKNGRIFWLKIKERNTEKDALLVIGRDQAESEALRTLAKTGDFVVELIDITGPTALLRMPVSGPVTSSELKLDIPLDLKLSEMHLGEAKDVDEVMRIAALITGFYSTKARGREAGVSLGLVK